MESPDVDIMSIVLNLTTTASAETQKATVEKYMTQDVEFRHPVCLIPRGRNSRDTVLKVFQWYRILSPTVDLKVNSVVFDQEREQIYLDLVQWFKLFFLPVDPVPARLITRLELRKVENKYYISKQEDFYHPVDFTKLLFPPLAPLVSLWLVISGVFSFWAATVGQSLGYWATTSCDPADKNGVYHQDLYN
ncbi:hypothetical protein FA15DRAFT_647365 [Coprinopsis marcescibilis]|uniref:SigF-like NTF2-like domain-containing protein n=1 Tax=Coprinopsis marcescibilis TaxID=230819 RepID=A0A5C3KJ30_COPMA|nr:hypothetical protein FA15DRAFT_647365 [Coprinopsis marcescibilis]